MESKEFKHIAIAGNIGAGKTSLCTRLGRHFTWDVHYEDADNNPYLSDFYNDMRRWAFNLQIYFLNSRFKQIMQIQEGANTVIQDRTIYEDARIFAPNLHEMGLIENRDFRAYLDLLKICPSSSSRRICSST
jgi:deoxyadenosine/deoxycytidine kinase